MLAVDLDHRVNDSIDHFLIVKFKPFKRQSIKHEECDNGIFVAIVVFLIDL